ncbi:MAG: sulfotransferase [Deltaproteobacteria bacterium]|nr:sulfotransferase [Deltaproteobacteria bacterium]
MAFLARDWSQRLGRERPVVIVAAADSGARMLARSLTRAGVSLGDAQRPGLLRRRSFGDVLDDLARRNLHLPPQVRPRPDDLGRFQRSVYRHMQASTGAKSWGWQHSSSGMLGSFVAETFPDARFVHVVRDGRDVALCERPMSGLPPPLGRRLEERLGIQGEPAAVQAAAIWAFQVERFIRFSAHFSQPILTLRFEQLLRDPGGELQKLARFLELPLNSLPGRSLEPTLERLPLGGSDATLAKIEARVGSVLRRLGYSAPERATGRKRLPVLGS